MVNKDKVQEISNKIRELISNSPIEDIENNLNALLKGIFTKLDLIDREEYDVQTEMLIKTRLKLDALEARLKELETKDQ